MYALKMAKDIPELKAVSITDGVYGILSDIDARKQIAELSNKASADELTKIDFLISLTERLLRQVES